MTEVGVDHVAATAGDDRVPAVRGIDEVASGTAGQPVDLRRRLAAGLVVAPDHITEWARRDRVVAVAAEQLVVACCTGDGDAVVAASLALGAGARQTDARGVLVQAVAAVGRVLARERIVARARVERTALIELVHQQHAVDLRPAGMAGVGGGGLRGDQREQSEHADSQQAARDPVHSGGGGRVAGGERQAAAPGRRCVLASETSPRDVCNASLPVGTSAAVGAPREAKQKART